MNEQAGFFISWQRGKSVIKESTSPLTLAQAPIIFAENEEQCGRIIVLPMKKPFAEQRSQENNPGVSTAAFSSLTAGKPSPFTKTEKKWKGIR